MSVKEGASLASKVEQNKRVVRSKRASGLILIVMIACFQVAKAAYQKNKDPLDAAIFYLAMKKKNVLWGLFRSCNDDKMTAFFKNNFNEDR